MFSSLEDNEFFNQAIKFRKKYSNTELNLIQFFYSKTKIYPVNIIIHKNYIFFFVSNLHYFEVKLKLGNIRKLLRTLDKKIQLIRAENTLIKVLFSFFPDPYIHDIQLNIDTDGNQCIYVDFLSFEERGIAIGRKGNYIKAVNEIINKYIIFENNKNPIIVKCKLGNL